MEEAETKIRKIVKEEYLKQTAKPQLDLIIRKVIIEALKRVKIKELREAAIKSLLVFYNKQYGQIRTLFDGNVAALLAVMVMADKNKSLSERKEAYNKTRNIGYNIPLPQKVVISGVPTQAYMQDYLKNKVRPILDNLIRQEAKDPDDISGRNSLRNRAEMEVRYAEHNTQIEDLKNSGNRLVIASTHSDCSERCAPFQGKVYSLDGTSGKTDDGRNFVPLERATEIWYTTKKGKRYKNGLLGFNCRHFLIPYKSGYRFPEPDKEQEKREYAITLRQRELERNVRKWQIKAIENKALDESEYKKARQNAIIANKEYIEFSKKHNRAYYPSRVQVLAEEKDYFQYNEWAKIIGKENMPPNLAKFKELKYNNSRKFDLLRQYKETVKSGGVTNIGFEKYTQTLRQASEKIVGIDTELGKIKGVTKHLIDRIIGSDKEKRQGVTIEQVIDTLKNGKIDEKIKVNQAGKKSIGIKSDMAYVTINPDTLTVIQCHPLGSRKNEK